MSTKGSINTHERQMSLYEYKHPIINKDLGQIDNPTGQKRTFPTLESWYDVINDYEFQARCPIILKNSHKNKHFTFACHLKNCPFKILLSYQGPNSSQNGSPDSSLGGGGSSRLGIDSHHHSHMEDDEDDDAAVTAAIAAAVAAVADSEESIKGPFAVTKIEPYHNHPLEANLSLQRFVLSKIPKILQVDLKFDAILESLCNEDDSTVAKFRVAQYVEESGIIDIIKQRYGLTDNELDKKMLGHIARRVTTYKARFVLKRKKDGIYVMSSSHQMAQSVSHEHQLHHNPQEHHYHNRMGSLSDNEENVHIDENNVRAAAAAAAAVLHSRERLESHDLKRTLEDGGIDVDVDVGDHDSKRQMHRRDRVADAIKMAARDMLSNQDVDSGVHVGVDLVSDHKQLSPHDDMAEQLRLLSSHLKEVEAEENVSDGTLKKEDIPDENIQPELRGQ